MHGVTGAEARAYLERLGLLEHFEAVGRSLPPLTDAQRARLRAIVAQSYEDAAAAEQSA